MNKTTCFLSIVCLFLLLPGAVFVPTAEGAAENDPLMNLLPEGTVFCVRVNNFTGSMGLLDQYLSGISPMPLSMSVNMLLGGILGDPMMNGVNKYGSFGVVGFITADGSEPSVVFLLPITDVKPFTSNANCTGPDANGLYTLNSPGSPAGPLHFTVVGNHSYLLASTADQADALLSAKDLLKNKKVVPAGRLSAADAKTAASAPAWLWLDMAAGYEMAAPFLRKGLEEGMEQALQQGALGTKAKDMTGLADTADQWLRQADWLSVALTPQADLLTAEVAFVPKTDSELAKMLVRDPAMKSGFALGGHLDSEAPISGLMNMNKPLLKKVNQLFLNVFAGMMSENDDTDEMLSRFNTMLEKSMKTFGSEVAFSFGYQGGMPPFFMREVIEINDAKAARELMRESTGLVNEMYGRMGLTAEMQIAEGAQTYKGTPIDKATIRFSPAEEASEQEKAMVEAMYGKDGLTYPFAITEKALFVTMGTTTGAEADLKKMLDSRSAASAMPADMQTALKVIPQAQSADFVLSLNVLKLMKGMSEMMAYMATSAAAQGAPIPPFAQLLEGIALNTQSAMAIGTHIDGGRARTHIALPKQHLMEIAAVAMQIQQKAMMQQMQMQQQQQP